MASDRYRAYMESDEWRRVKLTVRIRVYERYGGRLICERCGVERCEWPGFFQVHHLSYIFLYKELEYWDRGASETLLLVCDECHTILDKERRERTSALYYRW